MQILSHCQLSNQKRNWHKTGVLLLKVEIAVTYMHQFNYFPTQIIRLAKANKSCKLVFQVFHGLISEQPVSDA